MPDAHPGRGRTRILEPVLTLMQFGLEELRIWGLAAAGYRDEEIARRANVTTPAARTAIHRLFAKTGASHNIDAMQPRVVLALQYWRAVGKLREADELCVCPHMHTGKNGHAP